jgi:hypothetical protein
MGSTVFNSAKIWTFPTDNGRIGYLWAENTHEKKEGAHRARLSAMCIGYREQVVDRIFSLATNIPGGMLIVKNASPQSFISALIAQLQNPVLLEHTRVALKSATSNRADIYAAITNENRQSVQDHLRRAGCTRAGGFSSFRV